jgi:hypothetical protein
MSYINTEKCKQYDCLYHPGKESLNGCDYMIITGKQRGCGTNTDCTRYKPVSDEERIRLKTRLIEECFRI